MNNKKNRLYEQYKKVYKEALQKLEGRQSGWKVGIVYDHKEEKVRKTDVMSNSTSYGAEIEHNNYPETLLTIVRGGWDITDVEGYRASEKEGMVWNTFEEENINREEAIHSYFRTAFQDNEPNNYEHGIKKLEEVQI